MVSLTPVYQYVMNDVNRTRSGRGRRGDHLSQYFGRNSVPAVLARDMPQGFGFRNILLKKMPPPEIPLPGKFQPRGQSGEHGGKIQAIEQANFAAGGPQNSSDVEEAQRLHPEIISGEVVNPGIDQQNGFFIAIGRHSKI